MKMDKREQIKEVLISYTSIIDVDESKEFFSLFVDLVEVMESD